MRRKAPESDSEYSALPLLSRRALCTHDLATSDRLQEIERSFIELAHRQIKLCADDEKRVSVFWDCFDEALQSVADVFTSMLNAYREILVAHIAGLPSISERDTQRLIAAVNATGTRISERVTSRIPRWLKFACDGPSYTEEDIKFIDCQRQKWAVHNPGRAEDFKISFETECKLCGKKIRKLASYFGGAEFNIPSSESSHWVRHECYIDIGRIMKELLNRWVVPA